MIPIIVKYRTKRGAIMVFQSKVDKYYLIVLFLAIAVVGAVTIIPALFDADITRFEIALVSSFFLLTTAFLVWMSFSIRYRFNEDYLLVKGGLFRSKIAYEHITKVCRTNEILTGRTSIIHRRTQETLPLYASGCIFL